MIEWCIASDEGVVEDGFYSEEAAAQRLAEIVAEDPDIASGEPVKDVGMVVAKRDEYDENGDYIEDSDEEDS